MIQNAVPRNATLATVLHARAIAASARRLTLDIVLGVLGAALVFATRPFAWRTLAAAALCFAMYGVWAVAERHLESASDEPPANERAWRVARGAAAVAGIIAALVLASSLATATLGTWIS